MSLNYIISLFIILIIFYYFLSYKKRNLIYICFKGKNYSELAKLLIRSIDTFLLRDDVDILIITDSYSLQFITNWLYKEWIPKNKYINFLYLTSDEPYYLYRFIINDNIFKNYHKILYLDTDILITSYSINNLFDEPLNDKLHVIIEHNNYNNYEHVLQDSLYTNQQQLELQHKNIYPFNNGQFIFIYSSDMKNHFNNIINLIKTKKYNLFIDQQAMNTYFNKLFLTESNILDKYTKLFATDYIITNDNKNKCIMHFCGNIHNGIKKQDKMLQFLKLNNINLN